MSTECNMKVLSQKCNHKSIAVIGASYLQRPLVEKAKERIERNNSTK